MKQAIEVFLQGKRASANTLSAYRYDLYQFAQACEGVALETGLARYQGQLQEAAISARKRKVSVVNQFLYFLYQEGQVERYHRLTSPTDRPQQAKVELFDAACLLEETEQREGQLIALLILYLGLLPTELAQLKVADIDWDFQVVTVTSGGQKRIVQLPKTLLAFLPVAKEQVYVFDKKGKPYSRQWFFTTLSAYLTSLGHGDWTAKGLREQYIIRSLQAGISLDQISQRLGLKTRLHVEKYKQWISN